MNSLNDGKKKRNMKVSENIYSDKDDKTMIVDEDNSFYEVDLECLKNIDSSNMKKRDSYLKY